MRNYGIDLYRIVLTFMICVLHTLGQGGLLSSCEKGTFLFSLFWLLETASYCAVDGYALISGYNAREKEANFTKTIAMWFQVFFYSFILSFIVSLCGLNGDMSVKAIIKSAFPATFGAYWYFSAYLPLVLLEPFIIKGLKNLDDKSLKTLFILIIGLFCFSGLVSDAYKTMSGYSFVWLLLLFILGYAIKRLNMFDSWKNTKLFIASILMVLISWGLIATTGHGRLVNYTSPTILFEAIFLLVLFARFKPNTKIVKAIAPLTFGVYLFQNNRIIWENLKDLFLFVKDLNVFAIVPAVLALAMGIFVSGAVVDYLRTKIFTLIRISDMSIWLNEKIMKCLSKLTEYM